MQEANHDAHNGIFHSLRIVLNLCTSLSSSFTIKTIMTLTKISERVYADMDGTNGGNYGAIVLDSEIIFVDAGMIHHFTQKAREFLEKEHNLPVRKMVLTHHHSDHILGAQGLGEVVIMSSTKTHAICLDSMEGRWSQGGIQEWADESKDSRPELWKALQTLTIKLPDILFDDKIHLGHDQDVIVQHVGGHTPGSSIVIVEPEHICFCGDIIFNRSFPYAGDTGCDPDQWISVLEEMEKAKYDKILPGHGRPCEGDDLQVYTEFLMDFRTTIKDGIKQGLTVNEFIQNGMTPDYHKKDAGHREKVSVERWFDFYRQDKSS